jgi:hypothetical protein
MSNNPLSPEPSQFQINTVSRFGRAGLIAIALIAAVSRWWHPNSTHPSASSTASKPV